VLAQVVEEHERIVATLERRDADAALHALAEHLHTSDYAIAERPPTREKVRQ
jgi:DNA-binding GntR family transcriptional regulator